LLDRWFVVNAARTQTKVLGLRTVMTVVTVLETQSTNDAIVT
jgi:hypothetical protein